VGENPVRYAIIASASFLSATAEFGVVPLS
jgi:hypothetical protein